MWFSNGLNDVLALEEETIHGHGGKGTAPEDAHGAYPFRQGGIGATTEISRAHSGRTCRGATQRPLSCVHCRSAAGIQSKNISVLDQLSRPGQEMEYSGKQLGHCHTLEGVIDVQEGHGYSVIDGVKYPWEAGDLICVPVFAWHRHHNESQEDLIYYAATTGPFSMATGIALYEEENYPEYWVFAQKGEEAMKTLIPGGAEAPPGGKVDLDQSRWKPRGSRSNGEPTSAEIYFDQLNFAQEEEKRRRAGKVLVKAKDLKFQPTPMGRVAYGVDAKLGFHVKVLGTLFAEIPPGKRSGAHRHIYEETDHIIAGEGYSIIEDQKYEWKKGDTLVIPVFAWHQHFNTGREMARFLVHTNRPCMESTGYIHTQQGEPADYE